MGLFSARSTAVRSFGWSTGTAAMTRRRLPKSLPRVVRWMGQSFRCQPDQEKRRMCRMYNIQQATINNRRINIYNAIAWKKLFSWLALRLGGCCYASIVIIIFALFTNEELGLFLSIAAPHLGKPSEVCEGSSLWIVLLFVLLWSKHGSVVLCRLTTWHNFIWRGGENYERLFLPHSLRAHTQNSLSRRKWGYIMCMK